MGASMREDISSLISAMLHSNATVDLSRMLTQEAMFDASIMRAFLFDDNEEDRSEFFGDSGIDSTFLRGFMAGVIQVLMVERVHGEVMGRMSHAEVSALYDSARAYLMEYSME